MKDGYSRNPNTMGAEADKSYGFAGKILAKIESPRLSDPA